MKDISVIITSCNRFDLLEQTLDGFFRLNTFPIKEYILKEDSGNVECTIKILKKYGNRIKIISSPTNEGLLKSLDTLYSLVNTPYVFTLEDDWKFEGNKDFMKESYYILEDNPHIHQVWIRDGIPKKWLEDKRDNYTNVSQFHEGDWCGFSFNPSLRRLYDYKRMFPLGYNYHNKHGNNSVLSEHECNLIAAKFNYRAVLLNSPACHHIGDKRSTYK